MPKYHYKAIRANSEIYEGEIEAASSGAVYDAISASGSSLVFAEAQKEKTSPVSKWLARFSGVKTQEKIVFARNLSAMTEAGLSVSRALSVMGKQTGGKAIKNAIAGLADDIKKGKTLSDSMKERPAVFSNLFVSMVKAGEESGELSKSLGEIANQTEKIYLLKKKITGAMIYPGVILFTMAVIGIIMLIYVVPTLTVTFKELKIELPISTRIVIFISDFLKDHTILFVSFVFLAAALLLSAARSVIGRKFSDFAALRLPVIGNLARENNAAKTARTLSSLLASGVEVLSAINITAEVMENHYYKEILCAAGENIRKGLPMSDVFSGHPYAYPVFVGEMIAVGEETGKLAEMLRRVASYYENEVEQKTKNMSTIVEPVLMVLIGVAVGFFAVSMILPMYSLVNVI